MGAATIQTGTERIRTRYAFTFISQSIQLLLSFVTAGIVPKVLGPSDFGNYSFILNTASTFRGLTDLGSKISFFTLSSKSEKTGSLTKLYSTLLILQLFIGIAVVGLSHVFGVQEWIWPHLSVRLIFWVTVLEWVIGISLTLKQLGDSKGLTIRSQSISLAAAFLTALGLVCLYATHLLNLKTYVGLLYATSLLSTAGLAVYLLRMHGERTWKGPLFPLSQFTPYWSTYAKPLALYAIYGTAFTYLDSYLIQLLYGSKEQGFLAVATRFSSFVLIFTSSALSIYWREITHHIGAHNVATASYIYLRFNRLLFFLTTMLSFWLFFNAQTIIRVFAGEAYLKAVPVLQIMAFYPLQQTFGQLSSLVFFAAERNTQYRMLNVALSVPSLLLTYFLLAPADSRIPGLELGALGIAIKMTLYGLLSVQVYVYLNARYLKFSFTRLFLEQGGIALFLAVIAGLLFHWPVSSWSAGTPYLVQRLASLSVLYFSGIAALIFYQPRLAGLEASDIKQAVTVVSRLWSAEKKG